MKSKFMTARLGAKLLLIQAIGPFANWDSVITSQTWFGFRDFRKVTKIVSYMKSWEIGIGIRLRLLKEHKSGDFSYGAQDFLYL